MFRKLTLALGATVAIGAAALIPTSASAHMHGGHGHGHFHGGYGWRVGIIAPTTYHRFRLLRHQATRQYARWPARAPHHGLRLSEQTMDGK